MLSARIHGNPDTQHDSESFRYPPAKHIILSVHGRNVLAGRSSSSSNSNRSSSNNDRNNYVNSNTCFGWVLFRNHRLHS